MVGGQASCIGRDSRMYQRRVLLELFCSSAREANAAAEFAASRKTAKYVSLAASYIFFPIAVETLRATERRGTAVTV